MTHSSSPSDSTEDDDKSSTVSPAPTPSTGSTGCVEVCQKIYRTTAKVSKCANDKFGLGESAALIPREDGAAIKDFWCCPESEITYDHCDGPFEAETAYCRKNSDSTGISVKVSVSPKEVWCCDASLDKICTGENSSPTLNSTDDGNMVSTVSPAPTTVSPDTSSPSPSDSTEEEDIASTVSPAPTPLSPDTSSPPPSDSTEDEYKSSTVSPAPTSSVPTSDPTKQYSTNENIDGEDIIADPTSIGSTQEQFTSQGITLSSDQIKAIAISVVLFIASCAIFIVLQVKCNQDGCLARMFRCLCGGGYKKPPIAEEIHYPGTFHNSLDLELT